MSKTAREKERAVHESYQKDKPAYVSDSGYDFGGLGRDQNASTLEGRQLFDDAMQQSALGLLDKAEKSAWRAWQIDSTLPEALGVAAQFAFQQGRYTEAIQYTDKLDLDDPILSQELREMALHLRGESHQSLGEASKAEQDYRQLLDLNPEHAAGNLSFAKLLGTCARRDEAIPLILRLVKLRAAGDLLMLWRGKVEPYKMKLT